MAVKDNLTFIALVFWVFFGANEATAQFLVVEFNDGLSENFLISDVQSLTSNTDTLVLSLLDGSTYAWSGFSVQKMTHETVITGVTDEEYSSPEVNVYPNPSNGLFHIDLPSSANDITHIMIANIEGRVVDRLNLSETNGVRRAIWNANDMGGLPLPNGVYLLVAESSNRSITKKLIVQR